MLSFLIFPCLCSFYNPFPIFFPSFFSPRSGQGIIESPFEGSWEKRETDKWEDEGNVYVSYDLPYMDFSYHYEGIIIFKLYFMFLCCIDCSLMSLIFVGLAHVKTK